MFLQVPAQATSLHVSTNSSLFYSSRANVYNYPMIEFHAHKAIIKSFCTHQLWFRSRHVLWILFIFAKLCTFGLSGLILGNRSFSLIDQSPFTLGTQHVLCRLSGIFMTRMALCCRLCKACVRYANDMLCFIHFLAWGKHLHCTRCWQQAAGTWRGKMLTTLNSVSYLRSIVKRSDPLFIYSFVNMGRKMHIY